MISTKGRYALRVLIDIAEQGEGKPVPLKETARRQELSEQYLQQIAKTLVENKMLKGSSGKGGGYQLTRLPKDYNIGEILTIMEGTLASVSCLAEGGIECNRRSFCKTLPMWKEYDAVTRDFFYSKTLEDLL